MVASVNRGYLTTKAGYIADAYYRTKAKSIIKVINPKGTRAHTSKTFIHDLCQYYKPGTKLRVNKIVKYKGLTRFYVGNGKYITSNKKFVKFV